MSCLFLGIDIGTYSSKGVLVDPCGFIKKSTIVNHSMSIPTPGWAEQDAINVWWSDVVKICHLLIDGNEIKKEDIVSVAFSAIGPTLLPIDSAGNPLRPGILYGVDTRAGEEINILNNKIGEDDIFSFSKMSLSSQAVGPKILWLKRHEPYIWSKLDWITTASSFIVYKMTGEKVIDRHTASHYMPLFDINNFEWNNRFEEELIPISKLPQLAWSNQIAGTILKAPAEETGLKEGIPVAVGTVDALSEAISVGAIYPGDLMIMYGSTTFFILVLKEPKPDYRFWTTAGAFAGQYNLAAGMATSGSITKWFVDQFAKELSNTDAYDYLFSSVDKISIGANGLLVLPYFSGERTPINDPNARGIIAGLTLSHSREHLFRAILEGVAYGINHNLETFNNIGAEINRIIAVGGGTKNNIWTQIVSNVGNFDQIVPSTTIGASYGDAFLAGLASGMLSLSDLDNWVKSKNIIKPNLEHHRIYKHYYNQYLDLYKNTKDIVYKLNITNL